MNSVRKQMIKKWSWLFAACFFCVHLFGQDLKLEGATKVQRDAQGRPIGPNARNNRNDSLQQRNDLKDSISIYYRRFDSARVLYIDSSISDFSKRFAQSPKYLFLGNLGNAATALIFTPNLKPGFDAGFHAYDLYRYNLEDTRFYQTTRPYTELEYILGTRAEQTIRVLHTQNITKVWNAAFDFRLISAPGQFKNTAVNHANIRIASAFSTKNRRYSGNVVIINNKNTAGENGGILADSFLRSNNTVYNDRFLLPIKLGGDPDFGGANFFVSSIAVGTQYKQSQLFLRHQYDFGPRDSVLNVEDSTYTKIFYPRFRVQHNIHYQNSTYSFHDDLSVNQAYRDSTYSRFYGLTLVDAPLQLKDQWRDITNEADLILFPEKQNLEQFIKAGAGYQALRGTLGNATENLYNLYLAGEYRNRTRNKKFDINANGRFYLSGFNAGDYNARISLSSDLGRRIGSFNLSFQNINRSPAFVFDARSSFLLQRTGSLDKENWTVLGANFTINKLRLNLIGNYYIVSNYTYWNNFYSAQQEATLVSMLHLGGEIAIKLSRRWNLYTELHVQQPTSNVINVPLLYTRNRIVYEGQFYKNLNLATGVELRYYSPFKANTYSPFNGQFVVQNATTISNLPDIAAFVHFRIKAFRAFVRAENLNTISFRNGFSFTNNNSPAPEYINPGFLLKIGFYWSFVN